MFSPVTGRIRLTAGILVLGSVLVGCQSKAAANRQPYSGSATASVSNGVQQLVLSVGGNFRFTPSTITVHPGKVSITLAFQGTGGAPHDWQLTGFPTDYVPLTSAGQTNSTTFIAPAPGKYSFVCTIHERQGQTGTLIVLPS